MYSQNNFTKLCFVEHRPVCALETENIIHMAKNVSLFKSQQSVTKHDKQAIKLNQHDTRP